MLQILPTIQVNVGETWISLSQIYRFPVSIIEFLWAFNKSKFLVSNILFQEPLDENDESIFALYINKRLFTDGPLLWSSGQEFLAANTEVPDSIPGATRFCE
jgi:hypothetical protein